MMDNSSWIDRLYSDEALTDNLDDDEARALLAWGEEQLSACGSEADATAIIEAIREINRRVGDGETFAALMPPSRTAAGPITRSAARTPAAAEAGDAPAEATDPATASTIALEQRSQDGRDSAQNNQRPS